MKNIAILFATAFLFLPIRAFALPGVTQFVPDSPGQFVYYRDHTFSRESYIGVIYYDDATYGFRYIAPPVADKKAPLPALEMQVYITIDPERQNLEFTGEKVEPLPRSQQETDIINYIHDFAYEMTARRQLVEALEEKIYDHQDYEQFGGEVDLEYDPIVPVFNLRKITNAENKTVLAVVTAGRLISSDDTSFTDFAGIPTKVADKARAFKSKKSARATPVSLESEGYATQTFTLDEQWEQRSPAVWTLGDAAMVTTTALNFPHNFSAVESLYFLRTLLLGGDNSYPDWSTQKIEFVDSEIVLRQTFYDSENGSFKYDFKRITSLGKSAKAIFALTVFAGAYAPNRKYFDGIFSSYTTK